MSVLKCKMCGAVLPESKDSVVECEYCGTRQTLPRMAGEKCKELFERANSYRQQKDFDSAVSVYNDIVGEFPNEPEAYWGLCDQEAIRQTEQANRKPHRLLLHLKRQQHHNLL